MIDVDSYVRAVNLSGIREALAKHGIDFSSLLTEVGLPTDILDRPDDLVSFRKTVAIYELGALRSGNSNFGLEIARNSAPHFTRAGPVMPLARFTKNLGEWLEHGLRYWRYHTNGYSMQMIRNPERKTATFRLIADSFSLASRHTHEVIMACVVEMARVGSNVSELNPTVVRFQHRKPEDISLHEEIFRCQIEFSADHTEFEFPEEFLEYKTKGGLRFFRPILTRIIQERIARLPYYDQTTTTAVSLTIPAIIGTGHCNIETVAEALNTNVKQLQRQLAKENTNFSIILEAVRERIARNLLASSDAPVARIAGLLDYSSTAPFTTAFLRWTGITPLKYRKHARLGKI